MTRCLLTIITTLLFAQLYAGGFQINAQGQRQLGMGHTGTGLLHNDGSYLFFNPGAGIFIDRKFTVTAGMTLLKPRTVYLEPAPGQYTAEMMHNTGTPFEFYAAYRMGGNFAFGVAAYTPFGSRAQWPDDWKGQFLIREINLKTIFIQPTVTYKVGDYFGIGAGFIYATGGFSLRKGVPTQNQNEEYGEGNLDGSASGIGYNVGVYFRANEVFSAGISYRSSVKVNVENGSAEFTVPNSLAEYFPTTTFNTELKLPSVMNAGIGIATGVWKFAADFNYVTWSSYDSLRIDFADNTDKLADIASARMYEDSWIARVGAEWHPVGRFYFRLGAYYDRSPVNDGYLTPETPDADRIGITTGTTVVLGDNLNLDLSFLFVEGMKRTDTNIETQFSGTYKSRLLAPGFGLTYQF
jgi:long-chain fatty acid transport protein